METLDEYGVLHQVWTISDASLINLVRGKMRDKKLIIADGHHRYETALNYRDERRSAAPAPLGGIPRERASADPFTRSSEPEPAPYEVVMMTFVNMDSPGLMILPTHRVVHSLSSFSVDALHSAAKAYFSVEEVDSSVDASRASAILRQAGRSGYGAAGRDRSRVFLLDRPKADPTVFGGLSLRQQSLDVVQLHKCLLEGALGLSEESIRNQQNISYVRDIGGGDGASAERSGQRGIPDESGAHAAGARYRFRRRSVAAKVHGLLSQTAERFDHLCTGVRAGRRSLTYARPVG